MRRRRSTRFVWCGRVALALYAVHHGVAPAGATVQEQRARLPPPAQCPDPVAGTWKSHSYDDVYGDWTIFTLEIHRVQEGSSELQGTIENESWYGTPQDSQPMPCRGQLHYRVSMDAQGTVSEQGHIVFSGHGQWRFDEQICGEFGTFYYNLDSFSGLIDPEILEFQSVNNDGGRAVDVPVVFRRIACHTGEVVEEKPAIDVTPPAFYPPEDGATEGRGCMFSKGPSR